MSSPSPSKHCNQGDQIKQFFANWAHYDFLKGQSSPTFGATFCLSKFIKFSPKQAVSKDGLL